MWRKHAGDASTAFSYGYETDQWSHTKALIGVDGGKLPFVTFSKFLTKVHAKLAHTYPYFFFFFVPH